MAAASFAALAAAASPGAGSSTPPANEFSVTRDRAGIPRIVARNFRSLGFGEGYACAQDNLCTLAEQFVTVNGEPSPFFGPNRKVVTTPPARPARTSSPTSTGAT
ncbi:MAG TPA: penicillin acylase family protein [Solirubrobacteraceae bacterium]|nr:penicillin acylase family protein [Solirubrobacteraceae bacterium]